MSILRATFDPDFKPLNIQQPRAPFSGCGSLIAAHRGELKEVIILRTYYNPKGSGLQPIHAYLWLFPGNGRPSRLGYGSANSCGYHKESAAIANTVSSCGITLIDKDDNPYDFWGAGSDRYTEIFSAIARAMGYSGESIWVKHHLT